MSALVAGSAKWNTHGAAARVKRLASNDWPTVSSSDPLTSCFTRASPAAARSATYLLRHTRSSYPVGAAAEASALAPHDL